MFPAAKSCRPIGDSELHATELDPQVRGALDHGRVLGAFGDELHRATKPDALREICAQLDLPTCCDHAVRLFNEGLGRLPDGMPHSESRAGRSNSLCGSKHARRTLYRGVHMMTASGP